MTAKKYFQFETHSIIKKLNEKLGIFFFFLSKKIKSLYSRSDNTEDTTHQRIPKIKKGVKDVKG